MGYNTFSPFGNKSIIAEFTCDSCNQEVTSEEIGIPTPNYEAEKSSDSYNENEGYAYCENCGKSFDVYVYAGFADGYVEIDGVIDDSIHIREIDDELDDFYIEQIDAIVHSLNFIGQFHGEISNLRRLSEVELESAELEETLRRQIFSGAITCLEDYLSTTLIQKVLTDDEYFKSFVRTYKPFRESKFDLGDIYEKLEKIKDIVKKHLVDVIYHNLPVVKGMYEDTLKVSFPDIADLSKIIQTRHDMVHRNGKTKDGQRIEISKQKVVEVIDKVEEFVKTLDQEIESLSAP